MQSKLRNVILSDINFIELGYQLYEVAICCGGNVRSLFLREKKLPFLDYLIVLTLPKRYINSKFSKFFLYFQIILLTFYRKEYIEVCTNFNFFRILLASPTKFHTRLVLSGRFRNQSFAYE